MKAELKGALGLCIRARKCVLGTQAVTASVKKNRSKLVLLCETAADGTKEEIVRLCSRTGVEIKTWELNGIFAELTGKQHLKVVAIEDDSFADMIRKIGCL